MAEDQMKAEIATELYKAVKVLGAKSDLLQWIGSYGDTRTDEDVLDGLRKWNAHKEAQPLRRLRRPSRWRGRWRKRRWY